MQSFRSILFLATLFGVLNLLGVQPGQAQELATQEGFVNARVGGKLVRFETFVARLKDLPAGQTRLPIALIAHGKPPTDGRMTDMRARAYGPAARDFALRGYLAVVVMRRGFGRSDGPSPVAVSCGEKTFGERFEADADDMEAALAVVSQRPDADPDNVVAIGVSAGGAAIVTLAARNPKGLRAVVNVSGGLRIEGCAKDNLLVSPITDAGGRAKAKSVWIYAENDSFFPPAIVDKMHEGYLEKGGDVRRVRVPAMGTDGHSMFGTLNGRRIWLSEADTLLRDVGLPTWSQANVRGLLHALKLTDKQSSFIERYLSSPAEKAMAKSVTSERTFFQFGAGDMAEARDRAMRTCETREPKEKCEIVVENYELTQPTGERRILALKPAPQAQQPAKPGN